MKLGMNLLLYTTQPDESTFPVAEKLQGMGFDSLEWPVLGSNSSAGKIGKFNAANKLDATAVTVFPPNVHPLSESKEEQAAALRLLKERIETTAELGGKLLCGPITQGLGYFTGQGPTVDERKRCVEMLRAAGDHAKRHDVILAVEYLNRFEIYFLNTAVGAASLCDEVDHPNVKTMIDSFHAHIEEKNQHDAVLAIRKHIAHVHVSENDRGVPGSGKSVRWEDFFGGLKEIGYDGRYTIESFGHSLPDLAAAAKVWRPLFADIDDVPREGIAFIRKMLNR